jgi:hypothetical protein
MRPLPRRSSGFGARAARTIATAVTVLTLSLLPAVTARPSVPRTPPVRSSTGHRDRAAVGRCRRLAEPAFRPAGR